VAYFNEHIFIDMYIGVLKLFLFLVQFFIIIATKMISMEGHRTLQIIHVQDGFQMKKTNHFILLIIFCGNCFLSIHSNILLLLMPLRTRDSI